MLHDSYRLRHTCVDCKYCFIREEFDQGLQYYCTLNAPKRPRCGSVYMKDECFSFKDDNTFDRMYNEWEEWAADREVCSFGICDKWKNYIESETK